MQMEAKTSSQIDQLQSQVEDLNSQIAKTPVARRGDRVSQRDSIQSQLELQKALLDAIRKMAAFVESNGEISGGLAGGINQLARSIPDVLGTGTSTEKQVITPTSSKPSLANSGGLISDAMSLYGYLAAVRQIDALIQETDSVRDVADHCARPSGTP